MHTCMFRSMHGGERRMCVSFANTSCLIPLKQCPTVCGARLVARKPRNTLVSVHSARVTGMYIPTVLFTWVQGLIEALIREHRTHSFALNHLPSSWDGSFLNAFFSTLISAKSLFWHSILWEPGSHLEECRVYSSWNYIYYVCTYKVICTYTPFLNMRFICLD